jgi:RES domain-containing protein
VVPDGWDARTAIAQFPVITWQGSAWRIHRQRYLATDPGGSLKVSGRYHRGTDRFAAAEAWPALYLALGPETALGELIRHITPELLPHLHGYHISEVSVTLTRVADCRDATRLGVTSATMLDDQDYSVTQQLGAAANAVGLEGLLVPSATSLGDNLVVFTDQ